MSCQPSQNRRRARSPGRFTVVEPAGGYIATSSTATTVFDAATNAAWTGSESAGSSAYDTPRRTVHRDGHGQLHLLRQRLVQGCRQRGADGDAGCSRECANSSTEGPTLARRPQNDEHDLAQGTPARGGATGRAARGLV